MNSLERTGARDSLERLSLAVEQIGPIITAALLAPSVLGMAVLGGYAGYHLPGEAPNPAFEVVRFLLAIACGLCVAGPLLMPSSERTNAVRLLLLPIPRRTLYVAQAGGTLSDPWIMLAAALLLGIPIGLVARGAFLAAVVALAAGLVMMLVLTGLSAMATFLLHLLVRDRRRGELLTLIFIIVLPALALLPSLSNAQRTSAERRADRAARAERLARGEETLSERAVRTASRAYQFLPSEIYTTAARHGARSPRQAGLPLLGLIAGTIALHGIGLWTFGRLLTSPASNARRRTTSNESSTSLRIPGLSRAATAVAQAQIRLALRTPRGRSIVISPLLIFVVMSFLMFRRGDRLEVAAFQFTGGLGLAAFGAAFCLLSILPFAVNQFAIDRAGLTLSLLSPVASRELLLGKAVGNGLVVGGPALLCVLIAFSLFHDGPLALWVSIPLAFVATYALAAPGAATLSALFPRNVDLNSIGRGSNAHGAAGLLGLLVFFGAALPPSALAVLSVAVLDRPQLTPIFLLVWCALALIAGRALMSVVARLFEQRKENLALVAS